MTIQVYKGIGYLLDAEGGIRWKCLECGVLVHVPGFKALEKLNSRGKCQGCRAKDTFRQKPDMIGTIVDFWMRTDGWPESDSWIAGAMEHSIAVLFSMRVMELGWKTEN